ncbi:cytochrome c7 [Geobacter sp. 60473]|uniref:cytochrome c7 n=1 Tax=Geobacter sp. 60473 TaxID=3080755 RepID=UPI002B2881F7|nr:cytochrome c3 family protein [Geobacter sp. 60473]
MKRTVIFFAAMILTASVGLAADVILFSSKNGAVTFTHKRHSEFVRECRSCHEKTPGKRKNFGKDYAHKTCKGCHEVRGAGPTKCKLCHKG